MSKYIIVMALLIAAGILSQHSPFQNVMVALPWVASSLLGGYLFGKWFEVKSG